MRGLRSVRAAAAVALAAVTVSCGLVWESADFRESRRVEVPHVPGSALRVKTENGEIAVATAPGSGVEIVANLFATTPERLAEARVVSVRDAQGGLSVGVEWPRGR